MTDSNEDLPSLCEEGDLEEIRTYLEKILPSLPPSSQRLFCQHSIDPKPCNDVPCTATISNLSEAAARGGQAEVFAYLWDCFLAPRGITSISWLCLKTAALRGSIPLGSVFWGRDRDCFSTIEPPSVHPQGKMRSRQIEFAIRKDQYEYIDFMLNHGADISAGAPDSDLLRMVVRCATNDATTLQRVIFLTSRGVEANHSQALHEVAAGDCTELASCLLDRGAKVDAVTDHDKLSPLMIASNAGSCDMVKLLVDRGADIGLVDREGKDAIAFAIASGHDDIARLLQSTHHSSNA